MTRRDFIARSASAAAVSLVAPPSGAAQAPGRKFTLNLVCGMIGVGAKTQADVNAFAAKHGFESVEARGEEIARMSADDIARLKHDLKARGLVWGAGFLPNGTRVDAPCTTRASRRCRQSRPGSSVRASRESAPGSARAATSSPIVRTSPATSPASARSHASSATTAFAWDSRYIGTPTLRRKPRHSFIHTMAEARELFAEVQARNVGLVLDSWHWFTAADSGADILALQPADIVAVDMNDAPAGVPVDEQLDNRRELPCATGVIDMATFASALAKIGYDGPARAEPFNQALNALEDDDACTQTIAALGKAVALIRPV